MGVKETLEKLSKLKKNTPSGGKTESKKFAKFYKPKDKKKNNLLVLNFPNSNDPFAFYHQHANLLTEGKTIPCKEGNLEEKCIICEVVKELKADDWRGNLPIWKPIEAKIRYYSPVVDLDDLESGVQYWGYGASVMNQFEGWLSNLEDDEKEFYNPEDPKKVIVDYDKSKDAANMYRLDKKDLKNITKEQIENWQKEVQLFTEVTKYFYKTEEEEEILVQKYLDQAKSKLSEAPETETADEENEEEDNSTSNSASSRLNQLKKGE